jgi:hypothetical protein
MAETKFTAEQLAKCAEREVVQRKNVYGRRVDAGKMTAAQANREIDMMQTIATRLRKEADAEAAAGRLI